MRKRTAPTLALSMTGLVCRATAHDPRFQELRQDAACIEARQVARRDDLSHRAYAIDRVEYPLLGWREAFDAERLDGHRVTLKHGLEAPQARFDESPFVDAAEPLHDDGCDRQRELGAI